MLAAMSQTIPSAEQVVAALQQLSVRQLQRLADVSGVPVHTLLKIRIGDKAKGGTADPRIGTVSQFWPLMSEVQGEATEPVKA
jgi:hypothetical protein